MSAKIPRSNDNDYSPAIIAERQLFATHEIRAVAKEADEAGTTPEGSINLTRILASASSFPEATV